MKTPVTLFGIGCFVILLIAAYSSSALGFLLTTLTIAFIIVQWYRNSQKLKNSITREQKMRLAADQFIHTRFSSGASQRKKK